MQFLDEAVISIQAGHGGPGLTHFRREKLIPLGGPAGGDGGNGGSVYLVADTSKQTLLDFKFQPTWKAEHGQKGGTSNKTGKSGDDIIVKVPLGTEVYNAETGELVVDLTDPEKRFCIARGGRGGKGNTFFKSATNRTPEHSQPGEPGEKGEFKLVLKLIAHVGLIGLPNAGKSTLISTISSAKPKIADYPFTTLVPNLGVVQGSFGGSFVVADIPGLIPGASEGKGLGISFLKHIERTKVLAHLVELPRILEDKESFDDPLKSFNEIENELRNYSNEVWGRPRIIIITKTDIYDQEEVNAAISDFSATGYEVFPISSATGEGVKKLIDAFSKRV